MTGSVGQVKTITGPVGELDFGEINLDVIGTHTYNIVETIGTEEGYTYDSTIYTMTVEVVDDNGIFILGDISYTRNGVACMEEDLNFINLYQAPEKELPYTGVTDSMNIYLALNVVLIGGLLLVVNGLRRKMAD